MDPKEYPFLLSLFGGLAAMSIIQIARRLFPLRGSFHRNELKDWLGDSLSYLETRLQSRKRSALAVFDLPIELLTAQLSATAEQVLQEVSSVKNESPSLDNQSPKKDEEPLKLVEQMAEGELGDKEEQSVIQKLRDKESSEYRARMGYAIQRNLDKFQIEASSKWRRRMLVAAIGVSFVLITVYRSWKPRGILIDSLTIVIASLFAGYLASIARDIVAIVEKLRR